jgi:hypothetical protein
LVARSSAGSGPLSAQGLNLSNPDIREEDECGLSITQLSAAPCSSTQASDSETLPISTSQGQPVSDAPPVVQAQRERAARDKPKLPKPYASNVDLWKEALGHLDESGKHNIENLIGEQDGESLDAFDAKSLAVAVQEQIDMAFKTQQHDSRADRLMGGAVAGLSKFLSAVDVAVSFDPVHAALPWAAVRSVLVVSFSIFLENFNCSR